VSAPDELGLPGGSDSTEVADLLAHPQLERFVSAMRGDGFADGEVLPYHQPGCFGCGPANTTGLGLEATVDGPDAVVASYTFADRFVGAPGVVHGGAVAALIDDLFGALVVRLLIPAVTAELRCRYLRPVHLDAVTDPRAWVVTDEGRDLTLAAELRQGGEVRVSADARFRRISLERIATRYERR
jgi:acyl-coenzyme A thioesterase PaaI-like protein